MRFAYADPPYLGTSPFNAEHHYGAQHVAAADYDLEATHRDLIAWLVEEYPDGWALSLGANTLRTILPMCPDDVRVCAWVKGWCSWKPGVFPAYAWEPVLLHGGRKEGFKTRDWVQCNIRTNESTDGLTKGGKPDAFCRWLFTILGAQPDDELVDLFPGSGAVGRAWGTWCDQFRFPECDPIPERLAL